MLVCLQGQISLDKSVGSTSAIHSKESKAISCIQYRSRYPPETKNHRQLMSATKERWTKPTYGLLATARCQLHPVSSNRLTVETIISYLQILDFLRRPVSPLRRSKSTHALWPRNNFRFLYTFLLNCPSFTRLVAFLRVFITCCQFSLVRRPRNQL